MQERIVKMFDEIAPTYDLVNRIVSFGSDKIWRKKAIKETLKFLPQNPKILDVACGSGDMIAEWLKYTSHIIGLDASGEMLKIAKKRFSNIPFYQGLAQNLPFDNDSFDCLSISFGLRNIIETQKAISEFHRVLKQNGILLILEFTKSEKSSVLRDCVDFYSNNILPKIGSIISKNRDAYKYLPDSIQNFYTSKELCKLIKNGYFEIKNVKSFNFSQVHLIIAQKI